MADLKTGQATGKATRRHFDVNSLVVTDNVPTGASVSLAGLPRLGSFAAMFRDELLAAGVWREVPAGGAKDADLG